ncbi:SseB family protein [Streptomyces sp. HUAS TT20]|uniref:SseB family protein n=1 Tax=Streptomyces sp. HUAS TT20 TaxID=3447509 RepID=UPI0021DAA019|nr:SseB family protein [Streptomyces sp. HUAS 15-9]UXY30704.1 SseB family protein [Streptomyces sp. HUAS 15-9]
MNEIPAEVFEAVAREALRDLAGAPGLRAWEALAGCDVLIPAIGGFRYARGRAEFERLVLPVVESVRRAPAVMVFTSEEALLRAFPQVPCHRRVTLCQLAAHWPADEVMLVIDAGGENSLTLSAAEARRLLAGRPVRPGDPVRRPTSPR